MAIYQITKDKLTPLTVTKFGSEGLYERKDLQRLLRARIDVLGARGSQQHVDHLGVVLHRTFAP